MSDDLVSDLMAETGLSEAEAKAQARRMMGEEDGPLLLPASERPLIRLAGAVANQWRMVGTGLGGTKAVAFDLTAVDVAARWLGITPSPHLLDGLGLLERAALTLVKEPR